MPRACVLRKTDGWQSTPTAPAAAAAHLLPSPPRPAFTRTPPSLACHPCAGAGDCAGQQGDGLAHGQLQGHHPAAARGLSGTAAGRGLFHTSRRGSVLAAPGCASNRCVCAAAALLAPVSAAARVCFLFVSLAFERGLAPWSVLARPTPILRPVQCTRPQWLGASQPAPGLEHRAGQPHPGGACAGPLDRFSRWLRERCGLAGLRVRPEDGRPEPCAAAVGSGAAVASGAWTAASGRQAALPEVTKGLGPLQATLEHAAAASSMIDWFAPRQPSTPAAGLLALASSPPAAQGVCRTHTSTLAVPPPVEQPGAPETVPARVPALHHHLSRRAGAGGGLDRLFWLLEGGRAAHRRLQGRQTMKNHCRGRGARRWRPPCRARGATSEVSRPASGSPGGAADSAPWAAAIWSSPAEGTRLGRWLGGAATPAASNGGCRRGRLALAPPD